MFGNWGGSGQGDLNLDGIVDAADAGLMFEKWTGDNATVIPETRAALLGVLGTVGLLLHRRIA